MPKDRGGPREASPLKGVVKSSEKAARTMIADLQDELPATDPAGLIYRKMLETALQLRRRDSPRPRPAMPYIQLPTERATAEQTGTAGTPDSPTGSGASIRPGKDTWIDYLQRSRFLAVQLLILADQFDDPELDEATGRALRSRVDGAWDGFFTLKENNLRRIHIIETVAIVAELRPAEVVLELLSATREKAPELRDGLVSMGFSDSFECFCLFLRMRYPAVVSVIDRTLTNKAIEAWRAADLRPTGKKSEGTKWGTICALLKSCDLSGGESEMQLKRAWRKARENLITAGGGAYVTAEMRTMTWASIGAALNAAQLGDYSIEQFEEIWLKLQLR